MENYNTKYVCTYSDADEDDEPYRQDNFAEYAKLFKVG